MKGSISNMKYLFAKSKAGHDKGKIYKIIEETELNVLLEDEKGTIKKKNRKHIQPIKGEMHVQIRRN